MAKKRKQPKTTTIQQAVKHLKRTSSSHGWHFHCLGVTKPTRKDPIGYAELVHRGHPETLPDGTPVSFTAKLSVNRQTRKISLVTNYDFDPFQHKPAEAAQIAQKIQAQKKKDVEADDKAAQDLMRKMAEDAMEGGKDIDDYDDEEIADGS